MRKMVQPVSSIWIRLARGSQHAQEPYKIRKFVIRSENFKFFPKIPQNHGKIHFDPLLGDFLLNSIFLWFPLGQVAVPKLLAARSAF